MVIVAVLLFVAALAFGALGVAGLTGKLSRNRWLGIRTPQSLRDDETFALANKVASPSLFGAASVLVIGGIATFVLPTVAGVIATVFVLAAALFIAATGGALGSKAAGALPDTSGCGTSCGSCSLQGMCGPA
ncbi:SdpI family protein [Prescottella subtropica]|uniref:SdpI family protein n=1 Tax=Prescottella subtropica TaxID=2545757 RepID=UPI0010F6C87F|nr:SdpI family protein [Prescottella subtropica]